MPDLAAFQLADVLTIVGASAAAALITSIVQLLKTVLPIIAARHWQQPFALVLAALLVIAATADANPGGLTSNAVLLAVLAWVWIGKGATQVYDKAVDVTSAMKGV